MMGGVHDRLRTLEQLVGDALSGEAAAGTELAVRWDGGEPVGPLLHPRLHAPLVAAVGRGWSEAELVHVHGRGSRVLGALVGAGLSASPTAVDGWRSLHRLAAARALDEIRLLLVLVGLLGAPPGGTTSTAAPGVDSALLERVRALLAKAESTTFEAEADALTAKAHELMARHAIDSAVIEAGGRSRGGAVASRRILLAEPYLQAKWQLLAAIARACGCRTVSTTRGAIIVVFGHAADLEAVELLHTSLQLQATSAMLAAGRDPACRTRGFRRAFLLGFADRIGERLQAATDAVLAGAAEVHGDALLPVLASRAEAVDAAVAESFPRLRTARVRAPSSGAGWGAGWSAGGRADLHGAAAQVGERRSITAYGSGRDDG